MVGILVFGSSVLIFLSPFFVKVTTECKSQYGACPSELNAKLSPSGEDKQMLNAKSLFQAKRESKVILEKNLMISEFSFQFKFPNILLVNILIKKPAFAIKNESNQTELIGEDGRILEIANNTSLPILIITGNLKKIGEVVEANQLFALKLIQGVNDMYQVRMGTIIDNTLVVELPADIKVIFPLDGDADILLGSLRVIYAKITNNDQKNRYSEIDLRFKNPVLR